MIKKKYLIPIVILILLAIAGGLFMYDSKEPNVQQSENVQEAQQLIESELAWYEISEIGIKFQVEKEIADELTYEYQPHSDAEYGWVEFSTEKLSQIPGCESKGLIGISKLSGTPNDYDDTDYITARNPKQFDSFFILIDGPQAVCALEKYVDEWKGFFIANPHLKGWSTEIQETMKKID